MPDKIIHIRSLTPGSVPTTSTLGVGEIAINVPDGKAFLRQSGSTDTIQSFVTTNSVTSGSIIISGSTILTGSLNITGSTTQIGNNNLFGNTTLSGSIIISGSTTTPTVQVYGNITHDGYVRFNPVSTNIDTSISASYIYVSGSTNDLYFSQNGDGYSNTTRLRWLEGNIYTGILTGGVVSGSVGGTTFNVSSGSGIIVTLNATTASREPYPTIKYVTWPSYNNVTPTYLTTQDTTWLGIDNNGDLIQQPNSFINGQFDDSIQIGSVVHPNLSTISLFKTFTITSYGVAQQTYEFIRSFGAIKVSGHTISASGSTLSVNRTDGVAYALGRNYINDANKPSLVSDVSYNGPNIFRYYKSGSVFKTDVATTIDPGKYNTPNTATGLSAVAGGQFTIQRLFYFPNQINTLGVYYGRETYNSITNALANLPYETFEENNNTLTQAIFVAYLIVKGGTSDLSNASDAKFIQAGSFRNTTSGGGGAPVATTLNDLSDVTISSPTPGDLLVYRSDGQWENTKTVPSITGSLLGTASLATTASYALTASYVQTAQTASYVLNAVSSSFASTASFAPDYVLTSVTASMLQPYVLTSVTSSMTVLSSSYAVTASYVETAQTASYVLNAVSSSFASTASFVTASNVYGPFGSDSVISSSYALTASYALNGGGGGSGAGFPFTGSAVITGSLIVTGSATFTDSIMIDATLVTSSLVNTTGGTTIISTQATGSYRAMFAKYTIFNAGNSRAGEFMAAWNEENIKFTDTSTTDIGDTSAVILTGSLTTTDVQLSTGVGAGWTVKTQTTYI